jgi:hypothetical protein
MNKLRKKVKPETAEPYDGKKEGYDSELAQKNGGVVL